MKKRLKTLCALLSVLLIMGFITGCSPKTNKDAKSDIGKVSLGNKDNTTKQPDEEKDPEPQPKPEKRFKDIKVKAVYVSGDTAGTSSILDKIIELANSTEVNAVVLDVKEAGVVNYKSQVPMVVENGLYTNAYDVDEVIKKLHDNNIYVIGRIVCFKDDKLASKMPELTIKKEDKQTIWVDKKTAWVNPYSRQLWQYNIDIALEAIDKGFDEIQFDYVRFPTPSLRTKLYYGENVPAKDDAIAEFLKTAAEAITTERGIPLSADIYAIVCESEFDGNIVGQTLEKVGKDIDYISPMIYPSHYANKKQNGQGQNINGILFEAPDLKPYDVVYQTLAKTKDRLSKVEGYKAKVRPYLQAFTASWLHDGYWQKYGAAQIKEQIKAVYDIGYEEWILWSPQNKYPEEYFEKE